MSPLPIGISDTISVAIWPLGTAVLALGCIGRFTTFKNATPKVLYWQILQNNIRRDFKELER